MRLHARTHVQRISIADDDFLMLLITPNRFKMYVECELHIKRQEKHVISVITDEIAGRFLSFVVLYRALCAGLLLNAKRANDKN